MIEPGGRLKMNMSLSIFFSGYDTWVMDLPVLRKILHREHLQHFLRAQWPYLFPFLIQPTHTEPPDTESTLYQYSLTIYLCLQQA